jgi:hypothetical protein
MANGVRVSQTHQRCASRRQAVTVLNAYRDLGSVFDGLSWPFDQRHHP